MNLAFAGQIFCGSFALKQENATKTLYAIPMVRAAYGGLILTALAAIVTVAVTEIPNWIGACACLLFLLLEVVGIMKASAIVVVANADDEQLKVKTFYMRSLTVSADSLQARAKTEISKTLCKKVYEAVRYSDPMSCEGLATVEKQIAEKFDAFAACVVGDDQAACELLAKELLDLIEDRKKLCMLLK